jgi:hypothetical protein
MQTKDNIVNATRSPGESPEVPSSLFYGLNAPRVLIGIESSADIEPETGTATIATRRGAYAHVVMDIDYVKLWL